MISDSLRWVLLIPFLIFGIGVWLNFGSDGVSRVQIERAKEHWRAGQHSDAVKLYKSAYTAAPKNKHTGDILWAIGNIYLTNLYDAAAAKDSFHKLVTRHPESPRAGDACLKLAEIYELELGDASQSINYLKKASTFNASPSFHRRVKFQAGNVYFKQGNLEIAKMEFKKLLEVASNDHLAQQTRSRLGKIEQIQKHYEQSIVYFKGILLATDCQNCRLEAQLGLIESYEFLGELKKAIRIAQNLPTSDYTQQTREALVTRLTKKLSYYRP